MISFGTKTGISFVSAHNILKCIYTVMPPPTSKGGLKLVNKWLQNTLKTCNAK